MRVTTDRLRLSLLVVALCLGTAGSAGAAETSPLVEAASLGDTCGVRALIDVCSPDDLA